MTHRTRLSTYLTSIKVSPFRYSPIAKPPSHRGSVHTHLSASSSTGDNGLPKGMRVGCISKRRDIGRITHGAAYGAFFIPSICLCGLRIHTTSYSQSLSRFFLASNLTISVTTRIPSKRVSAFNRPLSSTIPSRLLVKSFPLLSHPQPRIPHQSLNPHSRNQKSPISTYYSSRIASSIC